MNARAHPLPPGGLSLFRARADNLLCYIAGLLRGMVLDGVVVSDFAQRVVDGHLDYRFEQSTIESRPLVQSVARTQDELRRTADGLQALVAWLTDASVSIAEGKGDQPDSSSAMAAAVQEISRMTDRSAVATQAIAGEAQGLSENADGLRAALDRFHI